MMLIQNNNKDNSNNDSLINGFVRNHCLDRYNVKNVIYFKYEQALLEVITTQYLYALAAFAGGFKIMSFLSIRFLFKFS